MKITKSPKVIDFICESLIEGADIIMGDSKNVIKITSSGIKEYARAKDVGILW